MHYRVIHMLRAIARRSWLTKPLVFPLPPLIRTTSFNPHRPFSARKEKFKLFQQITSPHINNQAEQKPHGLSLVAKKIIEHSQQCSQMPVHETLKTEDCVEDKRDSSSATNELKKRLESLAINVNDVLNEPKNTLISQNTNIMLTSPNDENHDDSVESIILRSDLETISTLKPSPLLGTEDPTVPLSQIPCVGCGAVLHCKHKTFPGFLPSEHFKLLSLKELKTSLCQRCHYIHHCNAFVEVTAEPEEFARIISEIKPTRSVVLMVVDVMDIHGSIIPDLANYIGNKHPIIIAGNKADLLAPDGPDYLKNVKIELERVCYNAGLLNIRKCTLISAKTGFGIERLITQLFSLYQLKADVYIVGTANAGKSSLFNTLLASDYCKHTARDLIQRATISVWPGTTLNLLKFPIMRPGPRTVALRHLRLQQALAQKKELVKIMKMRTYEKSVSWELKEDVTMTDLRTDMQIETDAVGTSFGQKIYGFETRKNGTVECCMPQPTPFDPDEYDSSYWAYDTPGIINPDQIMNLLTTEEVPYLTPKSMVIPRCLFIKPGDSVFVSGLARIDYIQGTDIVILTVHCGPDIPIKIVATEKANLFYEQNVGSATLGIPIGGPERLMKLPCLVGKEFTVKAAAEENTAAADIQLSSIGWVSVAPRNKQEIVIKAYTPGLKGLGLRTPALVARFRQFKGKRIKNTQYFKTLPCGSALAKVHLNVKDE